MKKYNIDIDGVLCENSNFTNYKNATPITRNIQSINNLYKDNYIRIYTSRKTEDKQITLDWLKRYEIKFDEIVFDKPTCDYYIDDKAVNFVPYLRKENEEDKLVICISGGLDSTTAYSLAKNKYKNIECIFFNINQPYVDKERKILKDLKIPFKEIDLSFYNKISKDDYIIPNRNSIFANIACLYGNKIWIVGLRYENHYLMHDKNEQFYNYISLSLSQSMGKKIVVDSPFKHWTKTDILAYCLKNNLKHIIEKTTSCYHPTEKRCGKCSLCIKRYVAGQVINLNEKFSSNPLESDECKKLVKQYKKALKEKDFSHYHEDRIIESLKVLDK